MTKIKDIIKYICPKPIRKAVVSIKNLFSKGHIDNTDIIFLEKYTKYKKFTMIPENTFYGNLRLVKKYSNIKGCIVECGVWRGGMIAAISEILGEDRTYDLFDSFEGLPPVTDLDGERAKKWQNDKKSPSFFDNCSADISFAQEAMRLSCAKNYKITKGWFIDTLPSFTPDKPIAILRIDGDWYDSTIQCLDNLYKHVVDGGIIIIDDYYTWDGCTKAVHDFLSREKLSDRIHQTKEGICYIIKTKSL